MPHELDVDFWVAEFARNRLGRPEPRWSAPLKLDPSARPLLEQSLAEFQLGDGGGPAALIACDASVYRTSQPGLERVVDLWFEEEKEHSRLLGGLLRRYGVRPIEGHWSFSLFLLVRRWLGVRFELQALTLTELSSTAYYRLLRRHGGDPALHDVCSLILRDEAGHLRFQRARLEAAGAPWTGWKRFWWRSQFRVCGYAAAAVLWSSHGSCLRALGATASEFFGEAGRLFDAFVRRIERGAAASLSRAQAGVSQRLFAAKRLSG
ncbi:MAG: ferritin-like domain-containing protein [Verrucomicrobia bacterium]|nr:ferritin-like domain-containing protein [Verrucomicrobiota bacterium]